MSDPSEPATGSDSPTSRPPSPETCTLSPDQPSPSNDSPAEPSYSGPSTGDHQSSTFAYLRLDAIKYDHAHNDRFALDPERLRDLADSIARHGLINPILVTAHDNHPHLIAGFRRLEACRLLGWTTIPTLRTQQPESNANAIRLAENLIRTDLSPVEEAQAVARVRQHTKASPNELATHLNRSIHWIRHRLALANYPEQILDALHVGDVTLGVADELALIHDPQQRAALLEAAIRNGCTAAQAGLWRAHANAYTGDSTTSPSQAAPPELLGPPPRLLKACFVCQLEHDITECSQVTVCPACLTALQHAAAAPPPPAPTPP